MGLGAFPLVSLAEAGEKADAARRQRADGVDPLAMKEAKKKEAAAERAKAVSFAEAAKQYVSNHEAGWRNPRHIQQWKNTLATYVDPVFGSLPVAQVETDHVLKVLQPLWETKAETASRLRGRIEAVLDFARVRGWREGPNPALWRGHLQLILPSKAKVAPVKHHAALDWRQMPDFMGKLREQAGAGARALEFAILTAARSGEVRGAMWPEIDLEAAIWTVPPGRMKASREHRVPLSAPAVAILKKIKPAADSPLLFPGQKQDRPLSDMSLTAVLRRMGRGDLTAHGFRSSFRDWAAETGQPSDIAEAALAHVIGNKTVAAYQRGDLLERRRKLMDEWAQYCGAGPASDEQQSVSEAE